MKTSVNLDGNGSNIIAADFGKSGDYDLFLSGADVARDAMMTIFSHTEDWNDAAKSKHLAAELAEFMELDQLPPVIAGFLSELSTFCGCVASKDVDSSVYSAPDAARAVVDKDAEYLAGVSAGKQALNELQSLYMDGDEDAMLHQLGRSFSDMNCDSVSSPSMVSGYFAVLSAFSGVALGGCVISIDEAGDMARGIANTELEE